MSMKHVPRILSAAIIVVGSAAAAGAQPPPGQPWIYEADDTSRGAAERRRATGAEIGTLNMMTATSRNAVLSRVSGERVYDLSVQYFIGLPSWYGVDDLPAIIARGVLIDIEAYKGARPADDYRSTREDLEGALAAQRVSLKSGDIVLLRGGKITLDAAKWLAETHGAMLIGGDQLSLEAYRVGRPDMTVPVHHYLINERAIAIIQVDSLDELARDKVYEFAFIAAALRPRSGTLQFRPIALPLRPDGR